MKRDVAIDAPSCGRCGIPLTPRRGWVEGMVNTRKSEAFRDDRGWHHGGSVCAENVIANLEQLASSLAGVVAIRDIRIKELERERDALRDAAVALLDALNDGDIDVDEYDGRCTALRAAVALTDRQS